MRKDKDVKYRLQLAIIERIMVNPHTLSKDIQKELLVGVNTITKYLRLYNEGGVKALKSIQKSGHNNGNPIKLMFMDEMRYGLMSNYVRSWNKKGLRTVVPNQLGYVNIYLYSAISPIDGDSFYLFSVDTVNGSRIEIFLEELVKKFRDYYIILVWDKASFHKSSIVDKMENLISIFLPPYSPELNPIERWFEELRKITF